MFVPGPSFTRLVVDQCFHADGDKGGCILIMRAVQVCVRGDFWVCVALAKEEELPFRLGDYLAPEAEGGIPGRSTEDGDGVVFPELDRLFIDVAPVVVVGNKITS